MLGKKTKSTRGVRSPVTPTEIKGTLGDAGLVLVWNVSDRGLCVWVTDKLKKGEVLRLKLTKPIAIEVECEVRWCREIPDRSGYLIGLETTDDHEAFAEIHRSVTQQSKVV